MESNYRHAAWRVVIHDEAPGELNMAIDEAMLIALTEGASPPTIRFYAWAPPCLSLGRNQPVTDADLPACWAAGVDLVRRPTGGRAILHTDELTYSVTLLHNDPRAAGGVIESYRRLSEGLLAGLRRLGVEAVQARGQRRPAPDLTAICFETPADYEITAGGRKLVGSAQWRSRGSVLQHGTLPLRGDLTRIVYYLSMPDGEREAQRHTLRASALTLEEASGRALPFAQVAQALADGFADALNLTLVAGALTSYEHTLANDLHRRYATLDWPAQPGS